MRVWCVVAALLLGTVGTRLVQGYFGMLALLVSAVLLMPTLMMLSIGQTSR